MKISSSVDVTIYLCVCRTLISKEATDGLYGVRSILRVLARHSHSTLTSSEKPQMTPSDCGFQFTGEAHCKQMVEGKRQAKSFSHSHRTKDTWHDSRLSPCRWKSLPTAPWDWIRLLHHRASRVFQFIWPTNPYNLKNCLDVDFGTLPEAHLNASRRNEKEKEINKKGGKDERAAMESQRSKPSFLLSRPLIVSEQRASWPVRFYLSPRSVISTLSADPIQRILLHLHSHRVSTRTSSLEMEWPVPSEARFRVYPFKRSLKTATWNGKRTLLAQDRESLYSCHRWIPPYLSIAHSCTNQCSPTCPCTLSGPI